MPEPQPIEPPTLPLMNAAILLSGLATLLLGPILPILSRQWHLSDSHAGALLLFQFTGATFGGATVARRLPHAFLLGVTCAAFGFLAFALAPGLIHACIALLFAGFGVGRTIASVNIIAGSRFTQQTGSALSRLNLAFSFGALLSPVLAAQLAPLYPLSRLISGFAALFGLVAVALFLELRRNPPGYLTSTPAVDPASQPQAAHATFLLFVAVLFLYGGLETCFGGWLTTYALRYGQSSLILSQYTLVLLLCGLTAGRALATWLLLRLRESTLLVIALVLTISAAIALASATRAGAIATLAVLLGIVLAPIFPAAFALYMANKPTPRQAALVLAASGLGAAAIPWLMGVLSTRTNSLRLALTLPIATAAILLVLAVRNAQRPSPHEVVAAPD